MVIYHYFLIIVTNCNIFLFNNVIETSYIIRKFV